MKKYFILPALAASLFFLTAFSGCIIFHKITYEVKLDTPQKGIVTITAYDMRSDAEDKKDLEADKKNLFDYMLKSGEFKDYLSKQGKFLVSRNLSVEDGRLVGTGSYRFDEIDKVEGIKYEEGYHYLNLTLEDSVISTNGEVIRSKDYKRIVWGPDEKTLTFTMFSKSFEHVKYKPLAQYFKDSKSPDTKK